jgi:aminoglycoside phosphotransferase (APT) family kinase protein
MTFVDTYLQPEAPDPVLDEKAIMSAARRHLSSAGPLIEIDESGGEARAYVLEGDVVMKVQRPHRLRPRTSLAKEALFLGELDKAGSFPVPRVLGYGDVEGFEYICLTRMRGVAIVNTHLGVNDRSSALRRVGSTLRRIHEIDQTVLRSSNLVPGDRSGLDLRIRFSESFDRLADILEADPTWRRLLDIRAVAAACLEATPSDTEPVALHSNPGPEHVLVDVTGHFVGLIDFGDAYRSHPALDLTRWPATGDLVHVLDGYRALGALPATFDDAWRAGFVITELARAARHRCSPEEAAATIARLVERP